MIQSWRPAISHYIGYGSKKNVVYLLLSFWLLLFSCKNSESDLGINIRPDGGTVFSDQTDTFTVNAFTVREDSIKTDSLSTNTLGAMNDPLFGISTAGIASQLTLSQADISFGATPKVDSVILYIRWDKDFHYGNLNSTQFMNVYYLNENIEESKKYFSNYQAQLGAEIGIWNGNFNLTDSVKLKAGKKIITKAPGLRIKLYKKVGEDLANANPLVYSSVLLFKQFLKGIVLLPQKGGIAVGEGAIAGADFFSGNSQLIVHYNDTLQHTFTFNNSCSNFNVYDIKHSNPDLKNQLQHPSMPASKTYVQSMGGCKTKIEIPYLLNLVKDLKNERIIINEATLVLTPQNGTVSTTYPLPGRVNLFQPDKISKRNSAILDFLDFIDPIIGKYSIYSGGYNTLTGQYTIRFTRYLQDMLDKNLIIGENNNRGFYVTIPSDQPITPSRLVLDNTRNSGYKALKLRITYSKIKT